MKALLCSLVLLGLSLVVCGDEGETSPARLLVSKSIQNRLLVEDHDIIVKYSLFNIGDSAAINVVLTEKGFGKEDFDVVGGATAIKLDRIAPHSNNSHVLVLRPKRHGYFNFTAAEVQYQPSDEIETIQLGFSSDPGQGMIIPLKEYEKRFSAHMLDWAAFAVMTLPSLGIPFLLWHSSKSKYEAIARMKKE